MHNFFKKRRQVFQSSSLSSIMMLLKRWYLQLAGDKELSDVLGDSMAPKNLVLLNSEGPMKKQNGAELLGNVQEVSLQLFYINIKRSHASCYCVTICTPISHFYIKWLQSLTSDYVADEILNLYVCSGFITIIQEKGGRFALPKDK